VKSRNELLKTGWWVYSRFIVDFVGFGGAVFRTADFGDEFVHFVFSRVFMGLEAISEGFLWGVGLASEVDGGWMGGLVFGDELEMRGDDGEVVVFFLFF
jgi:hypothetical protein